MPEMPRAVCYRAAGLTVFFGLASFFSASEVRSSHMQRESMYALHAARDALQQDSGDFYESVQTARSNLAQVRSGHRGSSYLIIEHALSAVADANAVQVAHADPSLYQAVRTIAVSMLDGMIETYDHREKGRKIGLCMSAGTGALATFALGAHTYFLFRRRNRLLGASEPSKHAYTAV